jgi:corrinoid protein of di/trimethylamine methyltransferase
MALLQQISEMLQKGKAPEVKTLVQQAIDEKMSAREILEDGLMAGMGIIGVKFKNNEIYVPEVLIAARAMNAGIALLRPLLVKEGVQARGRAVIGTVKGDLHDIGKNLVKMMLEGKGIEVIDLGTDVAADRFVAAAKEHNVQIICCSALLTTTMTEMKNVVQKVAESGIRASVKIMVGGAPVTESFCRSIGADFYEPDAASAADRALSIVGAA